MQLCSRIGWFEDNRIDSIDRRKSTEHERGDATLWKFNENTQYFFCIATQLQFRCSSINADLSNAEWLKYLWSDLYWDVPQPRPWQNSPGTCRLLVQGILKMSSTRGLPLEPYLWRQHSSVNSSPGRCRCRDISHWRALPSRRPLVSPVAADIKISLLGFNQVCLVSATNCCFQIQAHPQGAGGRAGRRQEQTTPNIIWT